MMQNQSNLSQATFQSTQADQWLSAYLFYEQPWEGFLTSAVRPFVSMVKEHGWVDQFFFIRYWENGPHIRLRLKGAANDLNDRVRPLLLKHFERYFSKHPSARVFEMEGMADNNSIAFVEYEPEVMRYGGADGITIAERQFMLSSQVVLDIFLESEQWSYQDGLTNAIVLHTAFAHAMKMDIIEATEFFRLIYRSWVERAEKVIKDTNDGRTTAQMFADSFERQKKALCPFVDELWSGLETKEEFGDEWLNRWTQGIDLIHADLQRCDLHRALYVLDSYVHMTNNRLGISNHDEGYLGFLIAECMNGIIKSGVR